jgi:hypothetical protein
MSATLKYDGPLPNVEVVGYGHFAPGDSKVVDDLTAASFDCDPCLEEGWTVELSEGRKKKQSADIENTKPMSDQSPRGPRNQATHEE